MKIKRMADARAIADLLVATPNHFQKWYCPGYDDDFPCIKLVDKENSNLIMIVLEEDFPYYRVAYTDTVNDTEVFGRVTIHELAGAIWSHRKFINQSGQLGNL